jgi:hypothetical protein
VPGLFATKANVDVELMQISMTYYQVFVLAYVSCLNMTEQHCTSGTDLLSLTV